MKLLKTVVIAAAMLGTALPQAKADSTDWVSGDDFYDAIAPFMSKSMAPADLAVRVTHGQAEYKVSFGPDTGPFSFAIYPTSSRASADWHIDLHVDAENLIGGPSRLCLHKFARAVDGDKEYYLLYLVDPDQPGLRCISLPSN